MMFKANPCLNWSIIYTMNIITLIYVNIMNLMDTLIYYSCYLNILIIFWK